MDQLGKLTTDTLVLFVPGVVSRHGVAFINCSNETGLLHTGLTSFLGLGNDFTVLISILRIFFLHMKGPQDEINSCSVV